MSSKYYDNTAVLQVIGCVYNNPQLLDMTDKYSIVDEDFAEPFHKVVFGTIYKIHELGGTALTLANIEDFLASRPKYEAIFKAQKGEEWLLKISENAQEEAFNYYYSRLKKFSLLRAFDNCGIDVLDIYDPDNILDLKKKQLQEDLLDNSTLDELARRIEDKMEQIRYQYVDGAFGEAMRAGDGIEFLVDKFKAHPEVGAPLYGPFVNTVTRGARLGKFYLRSAATGTGKSRTMVADACYLSCSKIYNDMWGWIPVSTCQPTLFITTEQDLEEVQTMMLSFVSNVNEDHILNGWYEGDEEDRVREASMVIKNAPLFVETMPDFSLRDIEDTIKKNIRDNNINYVMLDYIHTSMKILEEITKRSGGVKLREDQILFILSNKLKDICNQYGVFIESATQLNASFMDSDTPDQNMLRGSKAIADKIDVGSLLLRVEKKDTDSLESILTANGFDSPSLKLSIYKNRRGQYKGIYLWCRANLGTCRVEPMFATTWNYELIEMDDIKIEVEACAF